MLAETESEARPRLPVGSATAARSASASRTRSCTRPIAIARTAAARLDPRSSRSPVSSEKKLEIADGRDSLLIVGDDDLNDTHCAACGSLLFSVVREGEYVHVALGSLIEAPSIRPAKHIFVGSKAAWFEISDDLPRFEEHAEPIEPTEATARSLRKVSAISLFVYDLQAAKSFYRDVFDVPVVFEDKSSVCIKFDRLFVNLLHVSAAREQVEPAGVASRKAGSRFQLSIWVDDVDAACALLRERGATLLTGPIDRDWGMRTATFTDPDGHSWEIAEELPNARGS